MDAECLEALVRGFGVGESCLSITALVVGDVCSRGFVNLATRGGRQGSRLDVRGSGHSNLLDRQVERVRRFFPGVGCAPRHRTDDSVG